MQHLTLNAENPQGQHRPKIHLGTVIEVTGTFLTVALRLPGKQLTRTKFRERAL